jgi:membrane-associated protease RseP (regulator of RpoE activity)
LKFGVFRDWLPHPLGLQGSVLFWHWLRYFFTGAPLPWGGLDVALNQVAWAGWAGLLVTALNLIPVGQLDGGHLLYVLLGRRARYAMPVAVILLVAMGFVWSGWFIWAALILFVGRHHAEPLDQITPLTPGRRAAAIGGLVLFVLLFMPVPLITVL